jgi:TIR domain
VPANGKRNRARIFISHSRNGQLARRLEARLKLEGLDVWLDYSDIRVGALLGTELRQAIKGSRALVLLWSETAAASPWVATEILAAFHLNRYILPCVLGDQPLPAFLGVVYLPLKRRTDETLDQLARQAQEAPRKRNGFFYVRSHSLRSSKPQAGPSTRCSTRRRISCSGTAPTKRASCT